MRNTRFVLHLVIIAAISGIDAVTNSLAITMICRNEEVNFRSNLALWLPMVDYFVFMVDTRTTDNSYAAIGEILEGKADYQIIPYLFDGFGQARTASLAAVWQHFPEASHVLIADPGESDSLRLSKRNFHCYLNARS